MKSLGQLTVGIITAAASSLLVLGAILLSLVEGSTMAIPPTPTQGAVVYATKALTLTTPHPDQKISLTPTPTQAAIVVITATELPQVQCLAPTGWSAYTLVAGDTLEALAARSAVTIDQIREANCLLSATLIPGAILYLPPTVPSPTDLSLPSATPWPTPTRCPAPPGWIRYRIQPGETLTRISLAFAVRIDQLMNANCMIGTLIMSGSEIYVPNVPTLTPVVPATFTPTATTTTVVVEPTATFTEQPPTATPTETPIATQTLTPTETFTPTPTETLTPSETPSETPTPTLSTPSPNEDQQTPTPSATSS